jgi:hypothetical protein
VTRQVASKSGSTLGRSSKVRAWGSPSAKGRRGSRRRIAVTSSIGHGATFTIALPVTQSGAEPTP